MFDGLKNAIRGVINKLFNKSSIQNELKVDIAVSDKMSRAIDLWMSMYKNKSPWINEITKSLNLSATISSEVARLVTLELESEVVGNDFLNEQYQDVLKDIRKYCEYACGAGGLVFKPYVSGDKIEVDYVQASNFFPTEYSSTGDITSAIFSEIKVKGDIKYTRLEYHKWTPSSYTISNYAYKSNTAKLIGYSDGLGKRIKLSDVPEWAELSEELVLEGIERPLFAYFKIPQANSLENSSPLGVSVFSRAVDLIKEADKQYSRILWEYEATEVAIDADSSMFRRNANGEYEVPHGKKRLYRMLEMEDGDNKWNVFSPAIRDSSLFAGLNQLLRKIEFNCGLSYGIISDAQEIEKTATEIKTSKQRLYSTVKDIQKSLEDALEGLIYSIDKWSILAGFTPSLRHETTFNWDDSVIIDKDSELLAMQQDVASGLIRPELYIMKKYGVTEDEALKMMPDTRELVEDNPFDKGGM
ncbi:phage portal protein, putative, A118 family [Clostridioides difficile]|uniref:phage portal protein n=1 Tax=Clostridioides difficile TaxID=1496 RepID=UPI00097FD34A|nr:phage portal protein [Clostridioides difficile]SJQ60509.1 phage portal protein, putative, A118 family [Clostridioides difficile]HBH3496225.1 phage portal protein [Clostridioides difficile]